MPLDLIPARILPEDGCAGTLIGRAWLPGEGPAIVLVREDGVFDISRAAPTVALPVLFAAQGDRLTPAGKAQDDALNVVQRASQSAAAAAVNKLGARLAAGSGRLATLVRNDEDLAARK